MKKKIYDIEKVHNQFIKLYSERRRIVEKNIDTYLRESEELSKLRSELVNEYNRSTNTKRLIELHNGIEMATKRINGIKDIMECKEETLYRKKATDMVAKFISLPRCKEKRRISVEYIIEFKPSIYFRDIKNKIKQSKCINCGSRNSITISSGIYQCQECLYITECRIENVLVFDSNPNSVIKSNNYQKSVYFESHVDKLRMLKIPKIQEKVFDDIKTYIEIYQVRDLTANKLREILRYYKYKKLYKHIPYILCRMNNSYIPDNITESDMEMINQMFIDIERAWIAIFGKKKKQSFFGYPYCLRKILELLENYDSYLRLIPLTNSRTNLEKNDRIWRRICDHNDWEPIPTYRLE